MPRWRNWAAATIKCRDSPKQLWPTVSIVASSADGVRRHGSRSAAINIASWRFWFVPRGRAERVSAHLRCRGPPQPVRGARHARTDGADITGQMQATAPTIARATGTPPCRGWFCQGGKALAACAAAAAISDLVGARVVPRHANASGRSASCVCSIATAPPLTVTSNRLRTGGPGQETNGHLEEVFIRSGACSTICGAVDQDGVVLASFPWLTRNQKWIG